MLNRRRFLFAATVAAVLPSVGRASDHVLTATDAFDAMLAGNLILIDVRRPDEWLDTGVAPGAWLLDMRDENFVTYVRTVLERNPDHEVAVICRSGTRSGQLMEFFAKNDMTRIKDVTEGMVGGSRGTGWIPSGLPVQDARVVYDAMPKDLTAR